jgi:hypothetical protein
MFELTERLERMAQINRDIRVAAATAIANCDRLVALRADFNFECNELLNNLTGLMAGQHRTRLISRLQTGVVSMHRMLSEYQRRWPIVQIKLDPEGYFTSSAQVHIYVVRHIENSLGALAVAATPVRQAERFAPDRDVPLLHPY